MDTQKLLNAPLQAGGKETTKITVKIDGKDGAEEPLEWAAAEELWTVERKRDGELAGLENARLARRRAEEAKNRTNAMLQDQFNRGILRGIRNLSDAL